MSFIQNIIDSIAEYENQTGIKVSHVLLKEEINENKINMVKMKSENKDYLKQNGYYAEIIGYPIYLDKTLESDFILVPEPSK